MNVPFHIVVLLMFIYDIIRSDTSASEISLDTVIEVMSDVLDQVDKKITELENDVTDLIGPKPEIMAFSKKQDQPQEYMLFSPDQSKLSIPDRLKFKINEEGKTFQAPVSGIYHLTYTTKSSIRHYAYIQTTDNDKICDAYYENGSPLETMPFSVLYYLKANDIFYVQCSETERCALHDESSVLSGFLVRAQ